MNAFTLFTLSGPLLAAIGWFTHIHWLFWVGVGLAAINLFMSLASGAMRAPVLPMLVMLVAAVTLKPWYLGLAVGLLVWTALETVGELFGTSAADRL